MKKEEKIDQLTDAAINSVDGVMRAEPNAFLMTRINARLGNSTDTAWEKMLRLISKPNIAIPALCLLIMINVGVILNNQPTASQIITEEMQPAIDDISNTMATIYYDNENPY